MAMGQPAALPWLLIPDPIQPLHPSFTLMLFFVVVAGASSRESSRKSMEVSLLTPSVTFKSWPNKSAIVGCGVLAPNESSGVLCSAGRNRHWSSWPKRSSRPAWPSGRSLHKCSWLGFLQPTLFWRQLYNITSHSSILEDA